MTKQEKINERVLARINANVLRQAAALRGDSAPEQKPQPKPIRRFSSVRGV